MKTLITTLAILSAVLCFSAPRPPMHHGPRPTPHVFHRPPPRPHVIHHHHSSMLPIAIGAGVGSAVAEIFRPSPAVVIQPTPTVVQPVVVSPAVQRVWVPGYWQETKDAYGRVISRVWVEGHWKYL